MLCELGGGGLSIMKTILRKKTTKEQFKLKYRIQSKEQTLV